MSFQCDDIDDDGPGTTCPRCDGGGTLECYCGGDLCVCENYGERDCPLCFGEGSVSESLYQNYTEQQRQHAKERAEIWARIAAEEETAQ